MMTWVHALREKYSELVTVVLVEVGELVTMAFAGVLVAHAFHVSQDDLALAALCLRGAWPRNRTGR